MSRPYTVITVFCFIYHIFVGKSKARLGQWLFETAWSRIDYAKNVINLFHAKLYEF